MRGNGSIIQELEAAFRGAGWNVIKCIWGSGWDDLLARDSTGLLLKRMHECVDGEYQTFRAHDGALHPQGVFREVSGAAQAGGAHVRRRNLGAAPRRARSGEGFNAYKRAMAATGPADRDPGEDRERLRAGRDRRGPHDRASAEEADRGGCSNDSHTGFEIPISDEMVHSIEFYRPPEDARRDEVHARAHRRPWAGRCRRARSSRFRSPAPPLELFQEALGGSRGREASTTAAFVSVLKTLMKHPELGKLVVPIVPDEARTFGMESLFREFGIYASQGQRYKPVDSNMLLYYKEAQERPDSGRRHHRSGLHGVLHRRRHGLRELRRADDSVLHLLFDVRLPARGRFGVGVRAIRAAKAS